MKKAMFYSAGPLLFGRAKELRNHMTNAEIKLWGYLRTHPGGFKFRRQHPLAFFIVDFYCHAAKLVIEVDGGIHNSIEHQLADAERQSYIEDQGLRVIRFTNEDVLNCYEETIASINNVLSLLPNTQPLIPPSGG
jgi:cyclase